jgi:plasmid stabilization system protein ParE
MNDLLIAEGAERDYTESLHWYSERSRFAAEAFEAEVEWAFEKIAENPERYPLCDDRHRFLLLRKFPFRIIYRAAGEGQRLVVAIAHTSRRPSYWSTR